MFRLLHVLLVSINKSMLNKNQYMWDEMNYFVVHAQQISVQMCICLNLLCEMLRWVDINKRERKKLVSQYIFTVV